MSNVPRVGDLEIGQDLNFQEKEWAAERVGWAVIAALLLAALAGLFGVGPLSGAAVSDEAGLLRLEYERFGRYKAPGTLRVRLAPGAFRAGEARLWLDRDYLSGLQLQHITPQPDRVKAAEGRVIYVFRAAEAGGPVEVVLHFTQQDFGSRSGRIGVGDVALSVGQFIYP